MEKSVLRKAMFDDATCIQALFGQYYRHMYDLFPAVYQRVDGNVKTDAEIKQLIANETVEIAVAEQGACIVGFVCVRESEVSAGIAFLKQRQYGLVNHIVVDHEVQGQGIGKQLLDYAIAWSERRGMLQVELTVWHDNEIARELYTKRGFRPLTMQMGLVTASVRG